MNQKRGKLPIGIQDFPTLINDGCVYVDKTMLLYDLISAGRVYFLSRPRRFGKSLLISTLDAIFKGQKSLFSGTWIGRSDYVWTEYPVIRIDMSKADRTSPQAFNDSMIALLQQIADHYDVVVQNPHKSATWTLNVLIDALAAKWGKVVVLIDEYDKPILDNITNTKLAQSMRDVLRQFYTILKAQDGNLRFVILTGVTKFARVSVFSGLNNLQDISMADKYATLCGYTQAELVQVFDPWIQDLAVHHERNVTTELAEIKHWYNGYQFSRKGARVYNPFSTLLLFEQQEYRPHWFVTGTPTFLIDLIEASGFSPEDLEDLEVTDSDLETHDVLNMGLLALLYQTGYLTIRSYDAEFRLYRLVYPNFEVRESFTKMLLERLSEAPEQDQVKFMSHIVRSIRAGDDEQMFVALQTFFAAIPYELHQPTEKYYQTIFYLVFHLVGYRIHAEVSSNRGRMDAVLELKDRILIFEFKLNQSAEIALQQIRDKQYAQRYQAEGKKILLFGVNFDTTERNIVEWKSECI